MYEGDSLPFGTITVVAAVETELYCGRRTKGRALKDFPAPYPIRGSNHDLCVADGDDGTTAPSSIISCGGRMFRWQTDTKHSITIQHHRSAKRRSNHHLHVGERVDGILVVLSQNQRTSTTSCSDTLGNGNGSSE